MTDQRNDVKVRAGALRVRSNVKREEVGRRWSGAIAFRPVLDAQRLRSSRRGRQLAESRIVEAGGPSASLWRDALVRRMLLAADVLAFIGAFVLTVAVARRSVQLTWVDALGPPTLVVAAKTFGLYDRDETLLRKTTLDEVPKLFQLATLCTLTAWIGGAHVFRDVLSRHEALILWICLASTLVLARKAARMLALRIAPEERCLLIGDQTAAQALRSKLLGHGGMHATLVAQLDPQDSPWASGHSFAECMTRVRELVNRLEIHRAIVASDSSDSGEMLEMVRTLKAAGVRVSLLPQLLEVVGSSVEFDDLYGMPVMGVRRFELTRSSAVMKRCFDVCGAALALLVSAPLMIAIAIAVKLDSKGPVFFEQLRVGQHGHRFPLVKFRTMVQDAEAMKDSLRELNQAREGLFKIENDPRVTRTGRFLRKSHLDELPQLFNVLRGEMSLVGPRPLVLDEDCRVEGWQRRRLQLTPGMTGVWQILGPTRVSLQEMAAMDYLYVANWSLWGDVMVLVRTIPCVLARGGF